MIPLNNFVLKAKANEFAKLHGLNFNSNDSWICRWKLKYDLAKVKFHGEKKDANAQESASWITNILPQIQSKYKADDIFNCDESGLYICFLPDCTIAKRKGQVSGFKKIKSRVTILLCCNLSGSEKRDIFVVGKSMQPRCFPRGKNSFKPFTYKNSENAWMTSKLFTEFMTMMMMTMKQFVMNLIT